MVVFIIDDEPKTEIVPVTNKSPTTAKVFPSNVRKCTAFAELDDPSEVKTLLFNGFVIVLKPVPDVPLVPEVPDEPGDPLIPEVPLVPEVPDVPVVPLVPDVPFAPEVPLVPDVPLVPEVVEIELIAVHIEAVPESTYFLVINE